MIVIITIIIMIIIIGILIISSLLLLLLVHQGVSVASIGAVTSSNVIGVGLSGSKSVKLKSVNFNGGNLSIFLLTVPTLFSIADKRMNNCLPFAMTNSVL
jgi:hypothetical protein